MLTVKPNEGAVPADGVTITEAARRTGVSVYTLRYYERAGLAVTPVDRTSGGCRLLVAVSPGNEKERLALLESHRDAVLAQLDEIQENLKLLDHKIDVYRGNLAASEADCLWVPVRAAASGA